MASHTIAAGQVAKHDVTLTANTVDTFTFTDNAAAALIVSNGTAAVYYTTDGSTPTVAGANTHLIPAALVAATLDVRGTEVDVVKVISAGTPTISVERA